MHAHLFVNLTFRDLIEPTLEELDAKMREAELAPHEGKRKVETLWPIFKIHHQKSRYLYDLYHKRKTISKELYDYCLKNTLGDKNLIGKNTTAALPRSISLSVQLNGRSRATRISVAFAAFNRAIRISTRNVSAAYPRRNSKKAKWSNVSTAAAEDVPADRRPSR